MKTRPIRVLVALALLTLVTSLRADNPPTYLFQIDSSAVPAGFNPVFLALGGGKNVYASDYSTNISQIVNSSRIVRFSGDGTYVAQLGGFGTGTGQLKSPEGIAVDGSTVK